MVTINLTPRGLQQEYLLYKRDRFIMDEERVLTAIAAAGLVPSRQSLVDHYRATATSQTRETSLSLPT
jgi:biotin synthase